MAIIDSYAQTPNASVNIRNATLRAQTFTASENYNIYGVTLLMWRDADETPGTVTVSIKATDVDDKPTGDDLTSGTFESDELPTTQATAIWQYIKFDAIHALTSGTIYAIVVQSESATDDLKWCTRMGAPAYDDGNEYYKIGAGNWTYDGGRDAMFRTYDENSVAVALTGTIACTSTFSATTLSTAARTVRMIPFIYSNEIAYKIEVAELYMRFFYGDDVLLDDDDEEVAVVTPYRQDHIFELQVSQVGDVMRIVHPSYEPRTLSRTSATSFSLDITNLYSGPMLERNDILNADDITLTSDAITGDVTLTASDEVFKSGHVGAIFRLDHLLEATSVSGDFTSAASSATVKIQEGREYDFTTHGVWTGTIKLERSYDSGVTYEAVKVFSSNDNGNVQQTGDEMVVMSTRLTRKATTSSATSSGGEENYIYAGVQWEDEALYRVTMSSYTSGTCNYELQAKPYLNNGFVKISTINSPTEATGTVVTRDIGSTDATKKWAEGAFSDEQGWPVSITFYEERCVYGKDDIIYLSATGEWNNFEEGVNDNDSFKLQLASDRINDIEWVSCLSSIIVGTISGEWKICSNSDKEPITPTNFTVKEKNTQGSVSIQPIKVRDALLFVNYNRRKLIELREIDDTLETKDLVVLSEHITDSGIQTIAYQRNPDSIIWCSLIDGTLLSMVYDIEQKVFAWSSHPQDGIVLSVCIVPDSPEDMIWMSVRRTINGADVVYIERMAVRDFGDQEDAWFVDSGIGYDAGATDTFAVAHLEGEEVVILGDGQVLASRTVSGGSITLATGTASRVIIGLAYTYKLKPMRMDVVLQDGTTLGSIKRISEIAVSFYETLNAKYGKDMDNLYEFDWRILSDLTADPVLFTGEKIVSFDGGFDIDDPILITGSDPMPCTVRAIVPRIKKTGR